MEKNIYKEAILEAKAIRAGAIAQAKAVLQESMEPKIQEIVRMKLSEEYMEEELEEDYVDEADLGSDIPEDLAQLARANNLKVQMRGLDAVISGPNALDVVSREFPNAEVGIVLKDLNGGEPGGDDLGSDVPEDLAQLADDNGLTIEMDGLDAIISGPNVQEIVATEFPNAEIGGIVLKDLNGGEPGLDDELDEASLDSILKELDALGEDDNQSLNEEEEDEDIKDDEDDLEEEEITDETEVVELTLGDLKKVIAELLDQHDADEVPEADIEAGNAEDMEADTEDETSLEEILAELEQEDSNTTLESELEEAKSTIQSLQETLRDVNLLNAKLLYMNKLFKAKSLSESQKIQVVKAFDRTNNVKEVENTYQTLKESIGATKKTQIKESIGFASKPAGVAPKANIVEADAFVSRWQKIAGIK